MALENRRFIRFFPSDNAYAALWPDLQRVGKILDISLTGLAFEYITEKINDTDITHIIVFMKNIGESSIKLPCRVIYDIGAQSYETDFNLKLIKNRCGIQFVAVEKEAQRRLDLFLSNHTANSRFEKKNGRPG